MTDRYYYMLYASSAPWSSSTLAWTGEAAATPLDLAIPAVRVAMMNREILAGRNCRDPPILAAVGVPLAADAWAHMGVVSLVAHTRRGNRLGVAVLLMMISVMGGR